MKRQLTIFTLLVITLTTAVASDVAVLSERDIVGTARYVGMSGAMTAIGGDPSSVMRDNPAGLGLYRRVEATVTLDAQFDRTHQYGASATEAANRCIPTQASIVLPFIDKSAAGRVVAHNFMIGYQRLRTFDRRYYGTAKNNSSITDVMYNHAVANDVVETDFYTGMSDMTMRSDVWDNSKLSWLLVMGRDANMILANDKTGKVDEPWHSQTSNDPVSQSLEMSESGYVNHYSFDYALNIDDQWYVGLGLNILSLSYRKETYYRETFSPGTATPRSSLRLTNSLSQNGVGVNGAIGIIGRPMRWLRFGFSLQTPSAMSLTTTHEGSLYSSITQSRAGLADTTYNFSSFAPRNRYTDRSFSMPLRTSTAIAFQLRDRALLNIQYDFTHWKNMPNRHTIKVGGEVNFRDKLYLNAGYAFESEFYGSDYVYPLLDNDVRTDAETICPKWSQNASVAFGYRGRYIIAQLAYSARWQKQTLYPFELALEGYDMRPITHRVVFTLGFHM